MSVNSRSLWCHRVPFNSRKRAQCKSKPEQSLCHYEAGFSPMSETVNSGDHLKITVVSNIYHVSIMCMGSIWGQIIVPPPKKIKIILCNKIPNITTQGLCSNWMRDSFPPPLPLPGSKGEVSASKSSWRALGAI